MESNFTSLIFLERTIMVQHSQVLLARINNGFISSCQPIDDSPMDQPEMVSAMAQSSVLGGAAGLRIEGIANLCATRPYVDVPIIGIVKRDLTDSDVRITPYLQDVADLAAAGADIIAIDGTQRQRPETVANLINAIHQHGCLVMADCANLADGDMCHQLGADIIGSTLSGYTGGNVPIKPDLALVMALHQRGYFVMAEGRYNSPELAAQAIAAGANCVTVGSAITRIEYICQWFKEAVTTSTGIINHGILTALNPDNLGGLNRFELVDDIQRITQLPTHAINDAQAAAWYEFISLNSNNSATNMLFITISTGIGGGLVLNRQLQTGTRGISGHIGHTVVDMNGPMCGCGRQGCIEKVASGTAIGMAGTSLFNRVCSGQDVYQQSLEGDSDALNIIHSSASAVAELIANLTITLDLDVVVIGGSVGLAPHYCDYIQQYINEKPEYYRPCIVSAQAGSNAGLLGAASWFASQENY
jgi:putative N-acetylmannosamine-6-phosphate epimerase/predicted NBD/HSP70 family sugar kinase